jgi:hypothetical protein
LDIFSAVNIAATNVSLREDADHEGKSIFITPILVRNQVTLYKISVYCAKLWPWMDPDMESITIEVRDRMRHPFGEHLSDRGLFLGVSLTRST